MSARCRWPKLADFIIDSEADVLAYTTFPSQHRTKLYPTNPLERLNKEVKRRADVVGIFPNEDSIVRLIAAALLEANDDWQLQHRYMQIEGMAELSTGPADSGTDLQPVRTFSPPHLDSGRSQLPKAQSGKMRFSTGGREGCSTRPVVSTFTTAAG